MAFEINIPQSLLVATLSEGFQTRADNYERLVTGGQYLTVVISDGPFSVPPQIGGVNVLDSKQVDGPGVLLAEWMTRI